MTNARTTDDNDGQDQALRDKRLATWAGVAVNLPLAVGKIGLGWLAGSQALVADGVHSFSDLLSDAAVLWALGHSHRPPDAEHPFGHGRFETMATLVVAVMLGVAGAGILIDSGLRMINPPDTAPGTLALWAAALSILMKEALFHYTIAVGRRTSSAMMIANAWHHRSDAISSIVALVGIGAAMFGLMLADAVAAAIIALMLARIAWKLGRPALAELLDAAPDHDMARRVQEEIRAVPGLRDVHDLRLRRSGGALRGDGHVTFDGSLTLSEAHRLTEAARARVRAAVPEVADILLHAEPEGHADGLAAHSAPLRPEIERRLRSELAHRVAAVQLVALRLDYRDDGLRIDLVLSRRVSDETSLRAGLEACLEPLLPIPVSIVLTGPAA
jgi:cation diffusion facilitator family transporter